jgi:hypothetical protein
MENSNEVVFDDKKLPDILRDIYKNTEKKRGQINEFLIKLVRMVATPEDAAVLAPVIKDFMEVSVKNDEHIIKVAQIAQKIISVGAKASESGGLLSENEKIQLLGTLTAIQEEVDEVEEQLAQLETNV